MERRPVFGAPVPVSETSRLPSWVRAVPRGDRSPEVRMVHCALAETAPSKMLEAATRNDTATALEDARDRAIVVIFRFIFVFLSMVEFSLSAAPD